MKISFLTNFVILFCLCSIHTMANQRPIEPGSTATPLGTFGAMIFPRGWPQASEDQPAYIRLQLDKNTQLATTRVWDHPSNSDSETRQPIYLAFRVLGQGPGSAAIPSQALAIVRWKAGETAIWLRLSSSLSDWLAQQEFDPDSYLLFGFGDTDSSNANAFAYAYANNSANLPGNTRNPAATQASDVIDTQIIVNTQASNLQIPLPSSQDDRLGVQYVQPTLFDSSTLDVATAETDRSIRLGAPLAATRDLFTYQKSLGYIPTDLTSSKTGGQR